MASLQILVEQVIQIILIKEVIESEIKIHIMQSYHFTLSLLVPRSAV